MFLFTHVHSYTCILVHSIQKLAHLSQVLLQVLQLNSCITHRTVSGGKGDYHVTYFSDWLLHVAGLVIASLLSVSIHSYLQCQDKWILHTLNWGTNLLTSCCQLCSVEAGATTRKGPQMLWVYKNETQYRWLHFTKTISRK